MKALRSTTFLVVASLTLCLGACKKDDPTLTNAVIVYDPRLCACCGGLLVNFADTPSFGGSEVYAIANSTDLSIDVKELPLYVRVNWVTLAGSCRPTVRITKLERR